VIDVFKGNVLHMVREVGFFNLRFTRSIACVITQCGLSEMDQGNSLDYTASGKQHNSSHSLRLSAESTQPNGHW
jgi:hypothetical protein